MTAVRWLAEYAEDGEVAFRIGRAGDELVAEWIGLARLTARRDGSDARFVGEPGIDATEIEKVRRGSARLLLRHLEGKLAMHGAAVALGGSAIVFLGRSGQGKSTLAASLCSRAGAKLLSDDAVVLDPGSPAGEYLVSPVELNHWLDASARRALHAQSSDDEGKVPVPASRVGDASARLVALVELVFADGEPTLLPVRSGIEAMAALVPQTVRFVVDEPELQRGELEALAKLVDVVPVFRFSRPRSLDMLDAANPLLLRLIGRDAREGQP
jgi:hypothetical protein